VFSLIRSRASLAKHVEQRVASSEEECCLALTLEAANTAVVASLAKSRELGVLSVVAVYDEVGRSRRSSRWMGHALREFSLRRIRRGLPRRQAATQDLADANAMQPETFWHSFLKRETRSHLISAYNNAKKMSRLMRVRSLLENDMALMRSEYDKHLEPLVLPTQSGIR
jgi:hypothetical protein